MSRQEGFLRFLLAGQPHLSPTLAPGNILMLTFMDSLFCQVGIDASGQRLAARRLPRTARWMCRTARGGSTYAHGPGRSPSRCQCPPPCDGASASCLPGVLLTGGCGGCWGIGDVNAILVLHKERLRTTQ